MTNFSRMFEFGPMQKWFSDWSPKVQKCANLVDLVKRFQTNIYLQHLASIQKRTIPVKFAHLAEKSGKGSISNLSTKAQTAWSSGAHSTVSTRGRSMKMSRPGAQASPQPTRATTRLVGAASTSEFREIPDSSRRSEQNP